MTPKSRGGRSAMAADLLYVPHSLLHVLFPLPPLPQHRGLGMIQRKVLVNKQGGPTLVRY
jgi:hypothetical protein